ncbi:MAG: glycosyltransferase family 39 protein [Chloroflexota bacterium]|nr:glycosyltransferase family 39 protein [Chloroflexota bacterium]
MAVGALIRITMNNVTTFSPADETAYLNYSKTIVAGRTGFETAVQAFLNDPARWPYPSPSRWVAFEADAAVCKIVGCDYRALTWMSTLSGIALLPVVYAAGRRLLTPAAVLVGTALVTTSPLLLGLGRRALTDALFVLVTWVAIWAMLRVFGAARPRDYVAAVVAMGIAFGVKESFALFAVAVAAMFLIGPPRRLRWWDLSLVIGPPIVYALGFTLAGGHPSDLVALERIFLSYRAEPGGYELTYGSGPFYQPILDFLILSPAVTMLAIVAVGAAVVGTDLGARRLAAMAVVLFVGFGILLKDVRYAAAVAPLLALLTGWALAERFLRPRGLLQVGGAVAILVNASIEFWIFWTVFVVGAVYDPVLVNLLRALHAIP